MAVIRVTDRSVLKAVSVTAPKIPHHFESLDVDLAGLKRMWATDC